MHNNCSYAKDWIFKVAVAAAAGESGVAFWVRKNSEPPAHPSYNLNPAIGENKWSYAATALIFRYV